MSNLSAKYLSIQRVDNGYILQAQYDDDAGVQLVYTDAEQLLGDLLGWLSLRVELITAIIDVLHPAEEEPSA